VIVVNDAHRLAPWADGLYSSDQHWWTYYKGVPEFSGRKFGIRPLDPPTEWNVMVLRNTGDTGIEAHPSGLRTGKNSGASAINLAVHLGAARIVLLGYDMGRGKGQPSHFFGDHPGRLNQGPAKETFLPMFRQMVEPLKALGVEVVNCSRSTKLDCFPTADLRAVLTAEVAA